MTAATCKNCNSSLFGQYCSNCGQDREHHVSFSEIKKDFLDEAFDYDSRIFKTLKYLFSRPGFLTQQYWLGKRIKYLQPIRLYILASVIYYFINPLLRTTHSQFIIANKIVSKLIDAGHYENIERIILDYGQEIELLLFTPLTGAILMLLYKSTGKPFLHHIIASVHLSSFIFIYLTIINILMSLLNIAHPSIGIFYVFIPIYCVIMLRSIYNDSILKSLFKTVCIFLSVILRNIFIFTIGYLISILINYPNFPI